MENDNVYIQVLIDALKKKKIALEHIKELTQRQSEMLTKPRVDTEEFDVAIDEKNVYLKEINEIDDGFEMIFGRVRENLKENQKDYKEEIKAMQNYIREITDLAVEIEAMERRNKQNFQIAMSRERQSIKQRRKSKESVSKYYQNVMQATSTESFYMDRKK